MITLRRRQLKLILVLAILTLLLLPWLAGEFTVSLMSDIGIATLVALGLILLTGVGGTTSFGQAAFVGISAYTTAWLTVSQGLSPWAGLAFSLILTGFSAFVIGALTLRLGGLYLPISTIAWGISIPLLFGNFDVLGRHTGITDIPPVSIPALMLIDIRYMYYLVWLITILAFVFSYNLLRSRTGLAIRSLRGGSTLLASVGADAYKIRLKLLIVSAVMAGFAGWLYAHSNRFVSPSPFSVSASIEYLLMAMAGGLGSLLGAVIGSGFVLLTKNWLQDMLPLLGEGAVHYESIVFAVLFIALLHFARGGFVGLFRRLTKVRLAPETSGVPCKVGPTSTLQQRSAPKRGTTILSISHATKRFGGLTAVDDVSFDVKAGEILGLIGPNGAGKSTMFNLLTRTISMTSGRVRFLDRDISTQSQREVARLGLARTFQHVRLRPGMTLLDNVALGAYARTRSGLVAGALRLNRREESQLTQEAMLQLERVGLADRHNELAGSLPLGTQRILEVARALAGDPLLLVLDEPAAGLRRKEKVALSQLLQKLRDDGVTILIVEHDMEFVMNLVDRLVVMNFGSTLIEGLPEEVRSDKRVQDAYLGSVA